MPPDRSAAAPLAGFAQLACPLLHPNCESCFSFAGSALLLVSFTCFNVRKKRQTPVQRRICRPAFIRLGYSRLKVNISFVSASYKVSKCYNDICGAFEGHVVQPAKLPALKENGLKQKGYMRLLPNSTKGILFFLVIIVLLPLLILQSSVYYFWYRTSFHQEQQANIELFVWSLRL